MATLLSRVGDVIGAMKGDFNGLEARIATLESEARFMRLPFGGQFLLDPNEFNGWSIQGMTDDTNTQDLGNVGAAVSRIAGGFHFDVDVYLRRFSAEHRNNVNEAQAWGWRIGRQAKTAGSNTVVSTPIIQEVADNLGVGPRDYGNTTNQYTELDLSATDLIPAGEVVYLGVEAPTAVTTNRYVQVVSGLMLFERA